MLNDDTTLALMTPEQRETIAALDFIGPAEDWQLDHDGDLVYPEYDITEAPGWLIWCSGGRITMTWGCIEFEADVQDDVATAARRLLAAADAWSNYGEAS